MTNVIECLVVDAHRLVGVLHKMMYRKYGVVRLDNSLRNLEQRTEQEKKYKLTFGDGIIENVMHMRSGYSSRILLISNVPMPEPVPPPSECAS